MKFSIRQFLLINLLLAITITTTLTAVGNYYLDQKDIQEHLDTLMATSALSYQALLGDDLHHRPLKEIQKALQYIPKKLIIYNQQRHLEDEITKNYLNKFNFQIWNTEGKLLLHSFNAPKLPLTGKVEGFSDKILENQKWRVFTTFNKKAGLNTVIAERYDTRNELGKRIAQDDLYIMLLTFPLSGLLIWIIIGKSLDSLDRVAKEVANRAPTHLEPVSLHEVPAELTPVIDELNKLFNRLKEGFEREKRFAADAAHELRTPLAALKTQAQVALNSNNIEEKNIALQKLIVSVNRSAHIVQQLLTMSRLVSDTDNVGDEETVDLKRITREVLAMLAPAAISKQIDLAFEHEDNLPPTLGNATALSILVRNLVDNAIRYCQVGGKVVVKVSRSDHELVLSVKDNGPGISQQLRDRVFERFFRVIGTKSTGSGLGLAIVKQICDLYGARIELDTPPLEEKGLIIRVYFPIA